MEWKSNMILELLNFRKSTFFDIFECDKLTTIITIFCTTLQQVISLVETDFPTDMRKVHMWMHAKNMGILSRILGNIY